MSLGRRCAAGVTGVLPADVVWSLNLRASRAKWPCKEIGFDAILSHGTRVELKWISLASQHFMYGTNEWRTRERLNGKGLQETFGESGSLNGGRQQESNLPGSV
jgi:hypothetical protein